MAEEFLIIDTDGGADDAVAICTALRHCRQASSLSRVGYSAPTLLAISTVFGNVTVSQATANVKCILFHYASFALNSSSRDSFHDSLPAVYEGADGPLIRTDESFVYGKTTYEGYGKDGMGGCTDVKAAYGKMAAEASAKIPTGHVPVAQYLAQAARDHRGKLTVVALGPLTNIALACRLDPMFMSNLKALVVMGGSVLAMGNMGTAEFNFFLCPESAQVVFANASKASAESAQPKLVLAPMELCQDHALSWDFYDEIRGLGTPMSRFFAAFTAAVEKLCRPGPDAVHARSRSGSHYSTIRHVLLAQRKADSFFNPWDLFAVIPCLDPYAVLSYVDAHVAIGLHGEARGQCVVSWASATIEGAERRSGTRPQNVRILTELDRARIREMTLSAFAG
ncbi:Inosine/uridine-preferring nucleoside hydrolase domain-containing protein [Hyaloraphidium curvatum]|nr:Inosine/uridine-preferring nucleoside hydrolase domain-containing protein [Hyaloraphidium curvatum]